MLLTIMEGETDLADVAFLAAFVVAVVAAVLSVMAPVRSAPAVLGSAAVALIALGLLAL
jgi:hypothetical protein